MKRIGSLFVAMMLCFSMMIPAMAAEPFTPSVSAKAAPELVVDEDGNVGSVYGENGEIISSIEAKCLIITPVSQAETSTLIPDEAEVLLLEVYAALSSGEMTLPYEKLGSHINPENMVIRDLFDISWECVEHPEMVDPDGVVFKLTFNVGVDASTTVYAMTYNDGVWNPVVDVTNNGDGTVTVTLEHLCPVAFSVSTATDDTPKTGDSIGDSMFIWVGVMVVAAVALVVLVVTRRKNNQ